MLIDIHSHLKEKTDNVFRIFNFEPDKNQTVICQNNLLSENKYISAGVHPWNASSWSIKEIMGLYDLFNSPEVLLIGEAGLDKNCSVIHDKQMEIFVAQAAVAESIKKPVIVHIVKDMDNLLKVKKMFPNVPAWIIHGFRGGKREAEQYLDKGFFLSFGSRFRSDGLLACSNNAMFIETDESEENLDELYSRIAAEKSIDKKALEVLIENNFKSLFGMDLT